VGLVFERCYGGELFGILEHIDITPMGERIFVNRTAGAAYPRIPFTEAVIVSLLKQVMSVVKFMHGAGSISLSFSLSSLSLSFSHSLPPSLSINSIETCSECRRVCALGRHQYPFHKWTHVHSFMAISKPFSFKSQL
jgi:hypothetical protein